MNNKNHVLVGPFTQILTMDGLPLKGALQEDNLPILENAGIIISDGKIWSVGNYDELKHEIKTLNGQIEHLEEEYVLIPGFVDAHTHICFGGSRAKDYAMRNAGASYLEIARKGGGIWSSVQHTRSASLSELEAGIDQRAKRHLSEGVTTIEVKSGYGLDLENELKMLRAIRNVNASHDADLIPTCLAAHIKPKDFDGTPEDYLNFIQSNLFPVIKEEGLSSRVDIFVEETAFTPENSKAHLMATKEMGFDIIIHADQFSPGGSRLAAEVGALSADHLEATGDKEIQLLVDSNVIPVALPGASLGLGCPFTPARKLLDAGCSLVIASDWNPGSAPMGDLLMQAAILGVMEKLNTAEVFSAMTYRAAAALRLDDRGRLIKGHLADMIAFRCSDYRDILYHQGKLKPGLVWKKGKQIV